MLNESDKEIITITKEIFRSKKNDIYYDPDDLLKQNILKILFTFTIISQLLILITWFQDSDASSANFLATGITTLFFSAYSLYLNSKSKNFSILMALIVIISMTISMSLS